MGVGPLSEALDVGAMGLRTWKDIETERLRKNLLTSAYGVC